MLHGKVCAAPIRMRASVASTPPRRWRCRRQGGAHRRRRAARDVGRASQGTAHPGRRRGALRRRGSGRGGRHFRGDRARRAGPHPVEYEELPAILTPEEAMDEEAPGVHPGRDNISHEIRFERGDVEPASPTPHLVHEATYTTHAQYPGYMEPMGTVASIDPDGRCVVWTSTQSVTRRALRLAAALELPDLQRPRDPGDHRRRLRRQDGRRRQQPDRRPAGASRQAGRCAWSTTGSRISWRPAPACPSASRSSWAWTATD